MYDLVPTNEFAIESMSWPETPKSQILISPLELTKIFEGFTSLKEKKTQHLLCFTGFYEYMKMKV